jgi:hypothetical protein
MLAEPAGEGAVEAEPCHAPQVGQRRADDVHFTVGVIGPRHGNLIDAQSPALGQDQELGVEKPGIVFDVRKQRLDDLGAPGLEPALRI